MKNAAMRGLFVCQKGGTFRFAKVGVVFVFLTCSKLLSSILVRRLRIVMKEFDMDAQAGFRPDCGVIDGLFTTFVRLHKRKGHGLESWALFIDLVKTFDTVLREALFAILCRFGWPDHFVNILIRLHENALINV